MPGANPGQVLFYGGGLGAVQAFNLLRSQVDRALAETEHWLDANSLRESVLLGRAILWTCGESILLAVPEPTHLAFFLAAGDMPDVQRAYRAAEQWARQQGYSAMYLMGRRGWERSFLTREEGWRPVQTVMRKEL